MEINGLPLHAVAVHAAVVLAPLAALVAVAFALVPRWRWALRWPTLAAAVAALVSVFIAHRSGEAHLENVPALAQLPLVQSHQDRAGTLLLVTVVFVVLVAAAVWLLGGPTALASGRGERPRRAAGVEVTIAGLVVAASVAVLVYAVLTGDAGARAKWGA